MPCLDESVGIFIWCTHDNKPCAYRDRIAEVSEWLRVRTRERGGQGAHSGEYVGMTGLILLYDSLIRRAHDNCVTDRRNRIAKVSLSLRVRTRERNGSAALCCRIPNGYDGNRREKEQDDAQSGQDLGPQILLPP